MLQRSRLIWGLIVRDYSAAPADSAVPPLYDVPAAIKPRGQGSAAVPAHFGETHMGIESLIVWLIVGGVAGWLAGLIVKGYGFGLIGNIVVGIVGAFIAGWLLPRLGIVIGGGIIAAIINAVIGAVILLVIIGFFKR
jgi:uncharacterized membrane protein YeaQ/YmgE (transglycosylase-associated protein family)